MASIFVSEANSKSENPKAPRRSFKQLAMLVGLLPVIGLELVLRWTGIGVDRHDPYAEFGGRAPVFVRDGEMFRTAKAREPFLARQAFAAVKPANGFRIFCFGGSTVHGRPYSVGSAFPQWLELELAGRDPDRAYEVVNAGGISYASFRIVPMVREVMAYEPDAIVLATGHNEFLEDRTYQQAKRRGALSQILDSVRIVSAGRGLLRHRPVEGAEPDNTKFRTRLDEVNGYASYKRDPKWHRQVMAQFRDSVSDIVRICEEHSVPLVLVQLGSNLRDCPPFKSAHRPDLSPGEEQDWQRYFEQGQELDLTDPMAALSAYQKAAALDEDFALLSYRRAKAMDRGGDAANMLAAYQEAKDRDICPLRMFGAHYWFFEDVARSDNVILVDAATSIRQRSPESVPGFDWYLDHVHPTIGGHQIIGRKILERMTEAGLVELDLEWSAEDRSKVFAAHFVELGDRYLRDGARRLEWLDGWARRAKLADEVRPRVWSDHLRLGMRRMDFGANEAAAESFSMAIELEKVSAVERLEEHVALLHEQGRVSASAWLRNWLAERL